MSKKDEMRRFIRSHKGELFSATSLATGIGWVKQAKRRVENSSGDAVEQAYLLTNSRKARTIARKCGARVVRQSDGYAITL